MKKVSILGCGWTGNALKTLLDESYEVCCLSKDIQNNLKDNRYVCDVLVIAIPPRGNYLEVLSETMSHVNDDTQVILLSSISIYDGKPLVVEAESLLHKLHERTVVLRLGGLMGYDRIAGKYTAGKVIPNVRTNYIHRDDVIDIIKTLIQKEIHSETFDVVAPLQCMKKEIFSDNAKRFGFEETKFLEGEGQGKVLTPQKLMEVLSYVFKKEDVRSFWI